MKKLVILLVLLISFSGYGQTTAQKNGSHFIHQLFQKKYDKAAAYIDASVKDKINSSILSTVVLQTEQKLGNYISTISVYHTTESGTPVYFYYSKFTHQNVDIKIVFNKDTQKIIGFFLVPHKERSKTTHPTSTTGITGDWYGVLNASGMQIPLVFHIIKTATGYQATADSPKQQAYGIAVSHTVYKADSIFLQLNNLHASYRGKVNLKKQRITGTFTQNGFELKLDLTRQPMPSKVQKRPQKPKKPYPYYVKEVSFKNAKANITLAGTLTLPKTGTNFPAIVLINGSGPVDRNETVYKHAVFLVIADYLTRHGIAVLRYDKRGIGQSEGDYSTATSADFAHDAKAAFTYLTHVPNINPSKVGLIGHSEGGMIAPMVAAKDKKVDFIVLLAGPGVNGGKILLKQQELIGKAAGKPDSLLAQNKRINEHIYALIKHKKDSADLQKKLTKYLKQSLQKYPHAQKPAGMSKEQFINLMLKTYMSPWLQYFITYDPTHALTQVDCPVLALNGSHDLQVYADQNLPAIKAALRKGGNTHFTIKKMPGLNHLFQKSKTGSPAEYGQIEMTFSPKALEIIKNWILKTVN